jgi:hypothetical protein
MTTGSLEFITSAGVRPFALQVYFATMRVPTIS